MDVASNQITTSSYENILSYKELTTSMKKNNSYYFKKGIKVTVPDITKIVIHGSGNMISQATINAGKLAL